MPSLPTPINILAKLVTYPSLPGPDDLKIMTPFNRRILEPVRICLLIIGIVSTFTLISYFFGEWRLLSFGPDYIPMAPLTAILFIILSGIIFTRIQKRTSESDNILVWIITALIVLFCLFSILHVVSPVVPDIEGKIFDMPDQISGIPVGQMSLITAVLILFVCQAIVWGVSLKREYRNLSSVFAIVIIAAGLIVIEGYWYNAPLLYGGTIVPVALTTGFCFFFLGIALLILRKNDSDIGELLFGPSVKARLLRNFLPVMILFVMVDGWVFTILARSSSLNPVLWSGFLGVVSVLVIVLVTTVLSGEIGGALDRAKAERDQSDRDLRQAHSDLTQAYNQLEIQGKDLLKNYEEIASREEELKYQNEELVRRQIALEESEEKFRVVADNTYDWETWENPGGEFVYVSPSCKRISGYSPEEFKTGKISLPRIVHPLDLPLLENHIHQAKTTLETLSVEFRIVRRDGGIKWIHHVCRPIILPSGENLGRRGSNRDITVEKKTREELIKRDAQYQLISENSADAIWLLTLSTGMVRYVSPSIFKLLGYTPDEVMKLPLQDQLTPESFSLISEKLPMRISQFLSGDESQRVQIHEVYQPHKDGSIIPVEIVTTLIPGENGEVTEILGVSRDIRERKLAEHKIMMAVTQINQNLETLAILNDQIRNPLTVIELTSGLAEGNTAKVIHEQILLIDDLIKQVDSGFIQSEKVRRYLTKHYNISYGGNEKEDNTSHES